MEVKFTTAVCEDNGYKASHCILQWLYPRMQWDG